VPPAPDGAFFFSGVAAGAAPAAAESALISVKNCRLVKYFYQQTPLAALTLAYQ